MAAGMGGYVSASGSGSGWELLAARTKPLARPAQRSLWQAKCPVTREPKQGVAAARFCKIHREPEGDSCGGCG